MDRAASLAKEIRERMDSELKPDGSIVTTADKEVETFLRRELLQAWPGTSFWGEEFGRELPTKAGYWLVDPIDGTSNFSYGSPLWGISVALAIDDRIELGAVWLPDLGEYFLVESGKGAFKNGIPMAPIPPGAVLGHELVSVNELILRKYSTDQLPGKLRCAGAFVVDGTFTAQQRYRGLIGYGEYLYDAAPCILIAQELGADVRWASGEPLSMSELIDGQRMVPAWVIFPRDSGFLLSEPG
jgi:myo-inositol-1(or 4)-monophosphatase